MAEIKTQTEKQPVAATAKTPATATTVKDEKKKDQAPDTAKTGETVDTAKTVAAADTVDDDPDKDLFNHRISIDLTVQNAVFTRSSGNLISLTVTQPDGKVEFFERIVPVRAFPISLPDEFISIREPDSPTKGRGAEIGIIRRMADFPEDVVALITDELSRRYFTPSIKKIHSFSEKFGYCYWDVTTSAGRIEFIMSNPTSSIHTLEDGRVFMYDIDGNCFTIDDPQKLDKASYKKVEIYL